jgi:hypothetical protein
MLLTLLTLTGIIPCYSVADPDPGSGAFLTPRSGMGKKSVSGIRDEQPGSYFLELRNHFLGLKYSNSLMRIRDPGWEQFGSGKKVGFGIKIPDPQHCPVVVLTTEVPYRPEYKKINEIWIILCFPSIIRMTIRNEL